MTNDQDSSDTFQVVLVDLKKTVATRRIHCVKRPLTDQLKYVAISYRWGELQETIVDTKVGYVASITSFDLQDFYQLCETITTDCTMTSMDYVWVDAICVNQSNHDEREATIYHMNEIYAHATWILAVPDLHSAHLEAMANNKRDMNSIDMYQSYLYHLIHGNTEELCKMDQTFLDDIGVPTDQKLRQLLTKHTNYFAKGFMTIQDRYIRYDDDYLLNHLFDIHSTRDTRDWIIHYSDPADIDLEIKSLHRCSDDSCPFTRSFFLPYKDGGPKEWHQRIIERRNDINHGMQFLADLIVDWSSRVWVISEFHISKKKNNLKLWFNQLMGDDVTALFNLDMNDPRLKAIQDTQVHFRVIPESHAVYHNFYQQLIDQLNRQTFLEMMLKSKASKNEDRFYAIFPFFPQYKHLLQKEDLDNMNSILSVKLKLYKVMTNEHKKLLLFFSISQHATFSITPTFATSLIEWEDPNSLESTVSEICSINVNIALFCDTRGLYYLKLEPSKYRISQNICCTDEDTLRQLDHLVQGKRNIGTRSDRVDVVRLEITRSAILIGSIDKNTWILGRLGMIEFERKKTFFEPIENIPDDFPGFHVY